MLSLHLNETERERGSLWSWTIHLLSELMAHYGLVVSSLASPLKTPLFTCFSSYSSFSFNTLFHQFLCHFTSYFYSWATSLFSVKPWSFSDNEMFFFNLPVQQIQMSFQWIVWAVISEFTLQTNLCLSKADSASCQRVRHLSSGWIWISFRCWDSRPICTEICKECNKYKQNSSSQKSEANAIL